MRRKRMQFLWLPVVLSLSLLVSCQGTAEVSHSSKEEGTSKVETVKDEAVVLGDEQSDVYVPMLEGKRVALFSNHTGIVGDQTSRTGTLDVDTHFTVNADGTVIL